VSHGSGSHLPAREGSSAATCPAALCELHTSSIKKSLAVLLVQLGTHVPNAHTQVSKSPDRACKTCGQTTQSMSTWRADGQLQCDYSTTPTLWTTRLTPLQCQATRQHYATLLTECNMTGDKIRRVTLLKISFAAPSHQNPTA
jgi:hypothetical protein